MVLGSLAPVALATSPQWATVTIGGLVIQGPSRRARMRSAAPSTPPSLRNSHEPKSVHRLEASSRLSPLGQRSVRTPATTRSLSHSGGESAETDVRRVARLSDERLSPVPHRQRTPRGSGGILSLDHEERMPDQLNEAAEWATPFAGGLQITGPSRRWMMRQSAPSTPTLLRPSSAHPALQRPRILSESRAHRPHSVGNTVPLSGPMHARFGALLNRMYALLNNDEAGDPALVVDDPAQTAADEMVLQLEMLIDQLERIYPSTEELAVPTPHRC